MDSTERRTSLLRDHYDPELEARWDRLYRDSLRISAEQEEIARRKLEGHDEVIELGHTTMPPNVKIVPVQEELF